MRKVEHYCPYAQILLDRLIPLMAIFVGGHLYIPSGAPSFMEGVAIRSPQRHHLIKIDF